MYRFKQAFTLIELLVVMALMTLSVSIILPLTIKQIDAARYRGERELSALFIQRMQHNSFFLSRPVTVNAGGKALVPTVAISHSGWTCSILRLKSNTSSFCH